jgi:hypothetical protein
MPGQQSLTWNTPLYLFLEPVIQLLDKTKCPYFVTPVQAGLLRFPYTCVTQRDNRAVIGDISSDAGFVSILYDSF